MKVKALMTLSVTAVSVTALVASGAESQGRTRSISQSSAAQAAQQHPQIVAEFGGEDTSARSAYVRSVGSRVTAQSNITGGGNAFRITTLNSPVMNAFAVPGGYLYVTRQLIGLMNDEAELASVLGHEAGHVAARHSKQRQRASILSQILSVGAAVLTGSSELGQLAGQVSQGLVLSYSRSQELEADDLGVRYIAAAGYDPLASAQFLGSLGAATSLEARASGRNDERSTPSWARTHPLSSERVTRATQKARATGRTTGLRNRDQFLAQIDGIMVDDDPRQGVIDGRTFRHPDLRLRFTVPDGYGMQNGTNALSIVGQGGQAQFTGSAFNGSMANYVAAAFQSVVGQQGRVNFSQPRTTTIGGIPAAYSTARVSTQSGEVDLTIVAYQWSANSAYHFALITPAGAGIGPFEAMVQSVGRLSAAEAAAIRPRVIDVVTVASGDTVQSLANRMAYDDLKLERFRVLNGLAANSSLSPGQKVKLVVYGTR
ncbi:M48 family metalloprotease [Sphingosinicella sp. BN140058]|uniref:M48 family metalloprotease n=1 Tax=Sphingosinicella sp. BN140058 TaxID=1892855 RepID=UPI001011AEE5|nr:M48 family metalloprotease [Sphingosinicella sp. BN140058]QAY78873.1 LysM peptidoglycan-binding domain-containing protein [Sphingosinicella sp. BN140058]